MVDEIHGFKKTHTSLYNRVRLNSGQNRIIYVYINKCIGNKNIIHYTVGVYKIIKFISGRNTLYSINIITLESIE